jgi:predicted nucleic acid-binding protein
MILLDTSFIVSYLNEADQNHGKALAIAEAIDRGDYGASAITDYIYDEVMTVMLNRTKDLKRTVAEGDKLLGLSLFKVDALIFGRTRDIFKSQSDAKLSFTDCSTIAVSEIHAIPRLASFDAEFKKVAGLKLVDK